MIKYNFRPVFYKQNGLFQYILMVGYSLKQCTTKTSVIIRFLKKSGFLKQSISLAFILKP